MIFVIALIILAFMMKLFEEKYIGNFYVNKIFIILFAAVLFSMAIFMGLANCNHSSLNNKKLRLMTEYQISVDKSSVIEQMNKHNQMCDSGERLYNNGWYNVFALLLDYDFSDCKIDVDNINTDYDAQSPSSEAAEVTTEPTYQQVIIDGTTYNLVPQQ